MVAIMDARLTVEDGGDSFSPVRASRPCEPDAHAPFRHGRWGAKYMKSCRSIRRPDRAVAPLHPEYSVKRALVLVGSAALLAATAAVRFGMKPAAAPSRVMVHCPAGTQGAFVTPPQVKVAVGDTVQWRMAGAVVSDSVVITLKDPQQAWPFTGARPSGGPDGANTGAARTRGTYGYNVRLLCRMPGGTQSVLIDPDVIID